MKIYLSGPIAECSYEESHGWRVDLKDRWKMPVEFLDPCRRAYGGKLTDAIVKQIVELDKVDICASDAVLVRLNPEKPSVGTHQEVIYAWERGKLVVLVIPNDPAFRLSPWLVYHSHAVFFTVDDAMQFILGTLK
jgi:nucleoside 2-deoxyribosyltransferase